MNHLHVHTSSSLTCLSAALARTLSDNPPRPLARETVVTLSTGMGRWLSMELAAVQGVCAGMDFRFPNDTLDACFRASIPGLPESSPFATDTMAWRIAAMLPSLLPLPAFTTLTSYLGNGSDDRRLLQLARTLADTFDQYTIYRPQMILEWDQGQGDEWQPQLWRALSTPCPGMHRAALLQRFRHCLETDATLPNKLPPRISLFGISFLPPFHLEVFSLLARYIHVDIYLLNPCGSYWGDLLSEKRKAALALNPAIPPEALEYYETGNPLLSSLGTQGQEFFNLLLDFDASWHDLDNGQKPVYPTLLGTIRNDILELCDRGGSAPRATVTDRDRSLQIHSCHGPLREMEVLYDNLLQMFEELPGLEPRSVCVMTPDIEAYAPYITAVFGTRCGGRPAIPFTIADQSARKENPIIETFLRILGLSASRFGVNSMLEILECPQVMARFDLSNDELERIRVWLSGCGVRWGLDQAHRSALGFPPYGDFSWQAGLDRLFLGYALAPDGDRLFADNMPYDNIEGRQAQALGKLAAFINISARVRVRLATHQTLQEWATTLSTAADQLLRPLDENDTSCNSLYTAFQSLRDTQAKSGFDQPIGIEAVSDHLTGLLEKGGSASGFLNGRVTFCAMLPMRSIPQRVVCLVGMNDGIFPRSQRQPGFSLMSGTRRRGDRSVRDEDRYLFLEAIMSASERLYISYTGQNDRDNTLLPPSVVVAELLDYVRRGFYLDGTADTPPDIVTRHRLQSFNSAYFSDDDGAQLFSYAVETRGALAACRDSGRSRRHFIDTPLSDDPQLWQQLDVSQLCRFLCNPARTFLAQRLNVQPFDPAEEIDEREPFTLDSLAGYGLKQDLVKKALNHEDPDDLFAPARARSLLPPLRAGQFAFTTLREESADFAGLVAPRLGNALDPLPLALEINGTLLTGVMGELRQGRHVRWRCAGMKGSDRLALWVEHLLLNTLRPDGYPRESLLICKDLTLTLPPISNAAGLLADLVALYREGLCRPLHFFPQSSWLYLDKNRDSAESRWNGTDHSPSPAESAQPSFSLCFNGSDVLDDEFIRLAERVYGPLRAIAVEEKLS
jgi:exodeoxyribonuclease V gamma subunit